MIWARNSVKYANNFHSLVWKTRDYIRTNYEKISSLEKGRHEIPEIDGVFVMINEYETKDNVPFEAHKKYADLQILFDGSEVFEIADIKNLKEISYDETRDYVELSGKAEIKITLTPTNILILLPNEAHAVGLHPESGKTHVRKAVFKIPYSIN